MSDKVGSNESSGAKPKLLRDVLMHHQNAANQVMHDKSIIEALKPNLLGLIAANQANGNGASGGDNGAEMNPYAAYLNAAAAGQGAFNQQQLATTAALDIFAYCQYISSMMLFKAMANGESSPGGTSSEKTPSAPTSPLMSDIPQDYSMKGNSKKREVCETVSSARYEAVVANSPTPVPAIAIPLTVTPRSEHKKSNTGESKSSHKSSENGSSSSSSRKFVSSERRPRQAYNTKQLERLESEFQVSVTFRE